MANFTFTLGTLDLTPYLNVHPDGGFDPYGTDWLEPAFSDSPLADGQALVSVDAKNRPMQIPLFLHGAGNTKDQLHALVAQVNQALQAPGLQLQWKDQGASNTTYYDVTFGRFDPAYSYRRSEHGYAAGTLHLWVSPYGHTGTYRIMATGAGSGPLITIPIASVGGDAGAAARYEVAVGSNNPFLGEVLTAVAQLPHPSYAALIPVASFTELKGGAAVVGASGAPGSQALAYTVAPGVAARAPLSIPTVYAGAAHRVFGFMRAGRSPLAMRARDHFGQPLGATAMATGIGWNILDLGVLRVPGDAVASYALQIEVDAAESTSLLGPIILLPEDRLSLTADRPGRPIAVAADYFSELGASGPLPGRLDSLGNTWASMSDITAFGLVWASSVPTFAPLYGEAGVGYRATNVGMWSGGVSGAAATINGGYGRVTALVEALGSAAAASSCYLLAGDRAAGGVSAKFGQGTAPYFSLQSFGSAFTASVGIAATSIRYSPSAYWQMAVEYLPDRAICSLRASDGRIVNNLGTGLDVLTLTIATAVAGALNSPLIGAWNASVSGFTKKPGVQRFDAARYAAFGSYTSAGDVLVSTPTNAIRVRGGSAPIAWNDDVTTGRTPALSASAPAAAVLEHPLLGGPANDAIGGVIIGREQFRYGR